MCTKHFGLPSFNTSGGFWWFQKNISEHLWKSECGHSDAMWMHTHLGVWDLQAWLWWRRVAANRLYVLGYSTLGSIPIFYFISSNSYYFFPQKFVQFVSFLSRLFQATLVYDNQLLCDDLHHEATECDWRQANFSLVHTGTWTSHNTKHLQTFVFVHARLKKIAQVFTRTTSTAGLYETQGFPEPIRAMCLLVSLFCGSELSMHAATAHVLMTLNTPSGTLGRSYEYAFSLSFWLIKVKKKKKINWA